MSLVTVLTSWTHRVNSHLPLDRDPRRHLIPRAGFHDPLSQLAAEAQPSASPCTFSWSSGTKRLQVHLPCWRLPCGELALCFLGVTLAIYSQPEVTPPRPGALHCLGPCLMPTQRFRKVVMPLAHRDHPLQTDVEVFPLVSLQLLEREPGLTNELVVAKLVLVTHGDPATGQRERATDTESHYAPR